VSLVADNDFFRSYGVEPQLSSDYWHMANPHSPT
jgi:hypothetical protein